jgi:hypothetical protein
MPHQKHFVRCFTDDCTHFGVRMKSRAEGYHAVIKKYINLATCDLLTLVQRLQLMLEAQYNATKGIN